MVLLNPRHPVLIREALADILYMADGVVSAGSGRNLHEVIVPREHISTNIGVRREKEKVKEYRVDCCDVGGFLESYCALSRCQVAESNHGRGSRGRRSVTPNVHRQVEGGKRVGHGSNCQDGEGRKSYNREGKRGGGTPSVAVTVNLAMCLLSPPRASDYNTLSAERKSFCRCAQVGNHGVLGSPITVLSASSRPTTERASTLHWRPSEGQMSRAVK